MKNIDDLSTTAEHIVDVAESLVQRHGYNGFSYDDIAREVGIKKPSIHHHFATKADLIALVARRYTLRFCGELTTIEKKHTSAATQLKAYAELFEQTFENDRRLCVCGMLGAEAETLPPETVLEVERFFSANREWLTKTFQLAKTQQSLRLSAKPEMLAEAFLCALEGSLVVGRGMSNASGPRVIARTFFSSLLP